MIKSIVKRIINKLGYTIAANPAASTGDNLYRPLYSPWDSEQFDRYYLIASPKTLVSRDRCYVLERLLRHTLQVTGEVLECGVYKGGTSAMLAQILEDCASNKKLYLFDTFEGMPETDKERDLHQKGDFADTSLEAVQQFVSHESRCIYKNGFIPDTFRGLEDLSVSFCHIDLDIYKSIMDSLSFIWPRMNTGGVIVFDDYGFPSCPGARDAVDEFFSSQPSVPLCLHTGQAIVIKE